MKNLSAIIPVNDNLVDSILTDNADMFTNLGIKAERVDSAQLFKSGLALIHFIVPEDKVSAVTRIDTGVSAIVDDLRQAAKNYLDANEAN